MVIISNLARFNYWLNTPSWRKFLLKNEFYKSIFIYKIKVNGILKKLMTMHLCLNFNQNIQFIPFLLDIKLCTERYSRILTAILLTLPTMGSSTSVITFSHVTGLDLDSFHYFSISYNLESSSLLLWCKPSIIL